MGLDNANCPYGCNSKGQILLPNGLWDECPLHSKKLTYNMGDFQLGTGESLYDILQIPKDYQGVFVNDIDLLFQSREINTNCLKASIMQLKDLLSDIYSVISVDNNLYMESVFVYANPYLIDLRPFVYTILQVAFEHNISVLPATTINDLCGLISLQDYSNYNIRNADDVKFISNSNRLAGQGADWYMRTKLVYSDYLSTSICCILDNSSTTSHNLEMFQGFIEERSLRGLPTYVFSSCFFDSKREHLFYDTTGRRKLGSLNPYLLLGKSQENQAREKGWLRIKEDVVNSLPNNDLGQFKPSNFQSSKGNNYDLL